MFELLLIVLCNQKAYIGIKNETYVSLEDTEFTMQGTAISKALIEEKDPDKWMLLLEKTAENIKVCNSKI